MSDKLSQDEIDELLTALSTGDVDVSDINEEKKEKKIREYDFTRPDKFAKDQLRTLEVIHENYARLLNNFLSGYLRTLIEVEVFSIQSLIYSEFNNSIANPAILGLVDFSPFEGQIIIDVSSDVAYSMIERILGGSNNSKSEKEKRTLTEIELSLLKYILSKFINLLKEPWGNIVELKPHLEVIETNSQFAQIASPSESVAIITFNIKIGDLDGMINLCIPHGVIEPILPSLSTRLWFTNTSNKESTELERNSLKSNVSKSNADVRVSAGKSSITVKEMLNLQIGDIIMLDKTVKDSFEVYVEDKVKFLGYPGISKRKVAIKIDEIVKEGDEADE